jgi:hypothetical protein
MSQSTELALNQLINNIVVAVGDETGLLVKDAIDRLIGLEGVDVSAIQAQLSTLNNLLNANTAADGTLAQTLLASLSSISGRLDVLEADGAVAALQAAVAALQAGAATETAARLAGDANLQTQIDALQTSMTAAEAAIAALAAVPPSVFDPTTINNTLAAQATLISNLQAADAASAVQISDLQAAVQALNGQAAAIAAAAAAAAAAQSTANVAVSNAAAASAAAAAAQAAAAANSAAIASLQAANDAAHESFVTLADLQSALAVVASFKTAARTAMRNAAFASGDPLRN